MVGISDHLPLARVLVEPLGDLVECVALLDDVNLWLVSCALACDRAQDITRNDVLMNLNGAAAAQPSSCVAMTKLQVAVPGNILDYPAALRPDRVVMRDHAVAIDLAHWRLRARANAAELLQASDLSLAMDARSVEAGAPVVDDEGNLNRHRVAPLPLDETDVLGSTDDLPTSVSFHN